MPDSLTTDLRSMAVKDNPPPRSQAREDTAGIMAREMTQACLKYLERCQKEIAGAQETLSFWAGQADSIRNFLNRDVLENLRTIDEEDE